MQGNAISPEFKERFEELNITVNEGFYVGSVIPGMGAAKAGIQEGDVILAVDQVKIKQFSDLTGYLESKRPDDVVNVVLYRDGKEKKLKVTLAKSTATQFMGMNLRNLSPEDQKILGLKMGSLSTLQGLISRTKSKQVL